MTIIAKFTGVNSNGYVAGRMYHLFLADSLAISIKRLDGSGITPYESLSAFLHNWTEISVVAKKSKFIQK